MKTFKGYISEASIFDSKYPRSSEFTLNVNKPNAVHKALGTLNYSPGTTFKKSDDTPTSDKHIVGDQNKRNVSVTLEDDKGTIIQVWGTKSAFRGAFNVGNSKGGGKMYAADWEEVITIAHNKSLAPETTIDQAATAGEIKLPVKQKIVSKVNVGLGKDILSSLAKKIPNKTMIHYGRKTGSPSTLWTNVFKDVDIKMNPKSMTPKTDMKAGDWNISLKQSGGSQLMSGYKGDTMGVITAAYNKAMSERSGDLLAGLETSMGPMLTDLKDTFAKSQDVAGGATDVRKKVKAGTKLDDVEQAVWETIQGGTRIQEHIRTIMENHPLVKKYAVEEAMTGNMKFSDSEPKSNYLMVFSPSGTSHINKIDDKIVDTYASKVTWSVGIKSAGGVGALSLRAIVKDEYEPTLTMKQIISEAWDELGEDRIYLSEGWWSKIKDKASSAVDWVKEKALKILEILWNKVVSKIIALLAKGFVWIKRIFGWQPEVTSISNPYFV